MKFEVRKFIPNVISSKVGRSILVGRKQSPTILFAAGVVGVVATVVVSSRATLKLEDTLEETKLNLNKAHNLHGSEHPDYSEKDYQKDLTILYVRGTTAVVKLYAPAVILGGLSIAALTSSHHILSQRNTALMAAYAALEKGFSEYRKRVVDEFGEEKDRELRYSAETHTSISNSPEGPKVVTTKRVGVDGVSVYARFFDELCQDWKSRPEYNLLFLKSKQNYANDLLRSRGHLFLNEVYDMLGIDRSSSGSVVGWVISKDGDNYVDFGIFDVRNERARDFVNGREGAILLDFNVDGVIYDKI